MKGNSSTYNLARDNDKTSFSISALRKPQKTAESSAMAEFKPERLNNVAGQLEGRAQKPAFLDNTRSQTLGTTSRRSFDPLALEKLVNESLEEDKREPRLLIKKDSERSQGIGSYMDAAELTDSYLTYTKVPIMKILQNFLLETRSK